MQQSNQLKLHYVTAFHRSLQSQFGIELPVLYPKGDLHISEEERSVSPVDGPYWLVVAGGKTDLPAKIWSAERFQQVVDLLQKKGIKCVQGGAALPGHRHPHLTDVVNLVGRTDMRGFLKLIYHAEGVICPVTFAMHAAAAFDKPCVVIAGGREPWWWEAYVNSPLKHFGAQCASVSVPHRFLHTIGKLECCRTGGCWKTHVTPLWNIAQEGLCEHPIEDALGDMLPRCLDEIRVVDVVAGVLSYGRRRDGAANENQRSQNAVARK